MLSRSVRLALLIFLSALFVYAGCAQENLGAAATPNVPTTLYPETTDGLRIFLQDLMASVKSGDRQKSSAAYASLAMPADSGWFVKTFGPLEGARLESKNAELQRKPLEFLQKRIEEDVKDGRENLKIQIINSTDTMPLFVATLKAMVVSAPIYNANAAKDPGDPNRWYLGDFVYFNRGFRYIDRQVFQTLSTAPPMRIRIGGNVARARLINKVDPTYPEDAKLQHITGTVLLHVVIAMDGTVGQVQVVSGPLELQNAAIDAVKQWRYQPTLLNNEPVEVDTQVNIVFSLR